MAMLLREYYCAFVFVFISMTQIYAKQQLSEELWDKNLRTAEAVYRSSFIDGIRNNNLDEEVFLQFHMPDIMYVQTTIFYLRKAARNCPTTEVKCTMLKEEIRGYEEYLAYVLGVAHLRSTNEIKSTPAFDAYAEHYERVANDMDPAYMLVAIYPCYRLWNWFGKKLHAEADPQNNVYRKWISGNAGGSGGSHLADFINSYTGFDEAKVHAVFSESMNREYGIFNEASERIDSARTKKLLKKYISRILNSHD